MPAKCIEKRREASRRHYEKNKAAMIARSGEFKRTVSRPKIKAHILDHLVANPCIDCGETDPIVLEFDHKDGVDKCFEIATAMSKAISIETLQAEISKCDVRCANCHRRRTYKQRNLSHRDI